MKHLCLTLQAARLGDARAMVELADAHMNGIGVLKNVARAIDLFKQGAQAGDVNGMFMLAQMYEYGQGVPQSYKEARRLYELTVAREHKYAPPFLDQIQEKIRAQCPLLGKRVVIVGTSREDLNGQSEVATDFDHEQKRYVNVSVGFPWGSCNGGG